MDLVELQKQASKSVEQKYDAWSDLSGAERESLLLQEMLSILESEETALWTTRLMVARATYERKAFSWTAETFPEFLCTVGGRYRNQDGTPSGVAWDLASYVGVVWDTLLKIGQNPLDLATNWSKARVIIPTVKRSVLLKTQEGKETKHFDSAVSIEVTDSDAITRAVALVMNPEVTAEDMRFSMPAKRMPLFEIEARLLSDGTWTIEGHLSDPEFALLSHLIKRHGRLLLEG